ncbi:hypothetical protein DKX38_006704 [Salix brachista]|uniref:Uncharacterized protein n=1 Tax=Salix brachista TaxID=2182728 RepID=A0A5N5N2Z2_9ROSI|nr:hypothetical protein DKX38_006704 [Salix brachista]
MCSSLQAWLEEKTKVALSLFSSFCAGEFVSTEQKPDSPPTMVAFGLDKTMHCERREIKNATEERNVATKGDGRIDMASRDGGTVDPCPANTKTKVLMNSANAALNALE